MKPNLQFLFTKNKYVVAAVVLIHVVFSVAIIQQVYKSLGDEDLLSKLSLSAFFNRPLSLTVSSTGSKPVAIGKSVSYTSPRLGITQTLDTTKYQVFAETAQLSFAANKDITNANALTIVDLTDKLSTANFVKQQNDLKARVQKFSQIKEITFDFGETVRQYAGFSYEAIAPLSRAKTWNAEIILISEFAHAYSIKFVSQNTASAPEQLAALLSKLKFNDPTLSNQTQNNSTDQTANTTDPKDKSLEKAIVQTQAAVKRVYNHMCADVELTSQLTSKGMKPTYAKQCVANTANGFYFNKAGYLATEVQLVELATAKFLFKAINTLEAPELAVDMAIAHKKQLGEQVATDRKEILVELSSNASLRQQLATQIAQLASLGHAKTTFANPEIYVQRGKNNLSISDNGDILNKKDHYQAKVLATKGEVLILQVDQPGDYPIAKLNSNVAQITATSTASDTYVVGYAEQTTDADVFGTKATATPKVAKPTDPNLPGLTGAPIINQHGQVLGIFIQPSSGSSLPGAGSLANLLLAMQHNSISNDGGTTNTVWSEALADFFDQKYSRANVKFTQALQSHSDLAEANELKLISQKRIAEGLDQTNDWWGIRTGVFGNFSEQAIMIFSLMVIVVIAIAMGSFALINFIFKQNRTEVTAEKLEPAFA